MHPRLTSHAAMMAKTAIRPVMGRRCWLSTFGRQHRDRMDAMTAQKAAITNKNMILSSYFS